MLQGFQISSGNRQNSFMHLSPTVITVQKVISNIFKTGFAIQSLLAQLPCRLASTEEGSHWVIIVSGCLKSNFKKANKRQQHYSKYLLVNELLTRKSRQSLLEAVYVIGLPYNVFSQLGKAFNISLAGTTIERCISMATSALTLCQL